MLRTEKTENGKNRLAHSKLNGAQIKERYDKLTPEVKFAVTSLAFKVRKEPLPTAVCMIYAHGLESALVGLRAGQARGFAWGLVVGALTSGAALAGVLLWA